MDIDKLKKDCKDRPPLTVEMLEKVLYDLFCKHIEKREIDNARNTEEIRTNKK